MATYELASFTAAPAVTAYEGQVIARSVAVTVGGLAAESNTIKVFKLPRKAKFLDAQTFTSTAVSNNVTWAVNVTDGTTTKIAIPATNGVNGAGSTLNAAVDGGATVDALGYTTQTEVFYVTLVNGSDAGAAGVIRLAIYYTQDTEAGDIAVHTLFQTPVPA